MRRIKAAVALCLCLLIGGCKNAKILPQVTSFSCAVLISCGDFSVSADMVRAGVGQMTLSCKAPPTLAGLRVIQDGETVTLSQNGLETVTSPTAFPDEATFLCLCRVLDTVALKTDLSPSGCVQGTCRDEPYTLEYDSKTGFLTALYLPNRDFSVEFSDFYINS